jgi:hypothetical protein
MLFIWMQELGVDRREVLAKLSLVALGGSALTACEEQSSQTAVSNDVEAEPSADDGMVELLFVQNSKGITYADDVLTLLDVNPQTLYFADRPQDIAGFLSFEQLVDLVGTGPDSFRDEPPNATLIVLADADAAEAVMELSAPPRVEGNNLVFPQIKLIEGEIPAKGGASALFIDTIGRPLSPGSVAGVHRRHKRRRRRHHSRGPGPR